MIFMLKPMVGFKELKTVELLVLQEKVKGAKPFTMKYLIIKMYQEGLLVLLMCKLMDGLMPKTVATIMRAPQVMGLEWKP